MYLILGQTQRSGVSGGFAFGVEIADGFPGMAPDSEPGCTLEKNKLSVIYCLHANVQAVTCSVYEMPFASDSGRQSVRIRPDDGCIAVDTVASRQPTFPPCAIRRLTLLSHAARGTAEPPIKTF